MGTDKRSLGTDKFSIGEDKYSKGEDVYSLGISKCDKHFEEIHNQIKEKYGKSEFSKGDIIEYFTSDKQFRNFKDKHLERVSHGMYILKKN